MERIIVRRLQIYVHKYKKINPHQSEYGIGHSFRLGSFVRLSLVLGNLTVELFIDIAQAFNSISHSRLLKKITMRNLGPSFVLSETLYLVTASQLDTPMFSLLSIQ